MPFVHTAHNAEASGDAEILVTDLRDAAADKRLTVMVEPQPAACAAPAATPTPAPAPATGLPRTS